jgi:hypothetical protein
MATFGVVMLSVPVEAAVTPAQRCAAGKLRETCRKTNCKLRCEGRAARRGEAVEPLCVSRCEQKFALMFSKLEARGGCATTNDRVAIEAKIDAFVADVDGELTPGLPGTMDANRCASSKIAAASRKACAKLRCQARAAQRGVAVSPSCLQRAEARFVQSFNTAQGKGGCATSGDTATIEAKVDAFVDDTTAELPSTPTTSTTGAPTTTTSATTSTTTTTLGGCPAPPVPAPLGSIVFTAGTGSPDCGGPGLGTPPAPPFSGEVQDGSSVKIADLGLGCLYVGGGGFGLQPPPPAGLPDGFESVLDVTGADGLMLTLAGSDGTGPADCSKGAGPATHCINGNLGTDGMGACASDADCGGQGGSCALDANCFFGPPAPLPNPSSPGLSICIVNVVATDVCGTADLAAGASTLNVGLDSRLFLTMDGDEPCPICSAGVCSAGPRVGLACTPIGSKGTSVDCPPRRNAYVGRLPVSLSPISTGTSTDSAADGLFCPGQQNPGAFGAPGVRFIRETGSPLAGNILDPLATTLAGTFCVPPSGSGTIDVIADLPGPGGVSVAGSVTVDPGLAGLLDDLLCTQLNLCNDICDVLPLLC